MQKEVHQKRTRNLMLKNVKLVEISTKQESILSKNFSSYIPSRRESEKPPICFMIFFLSSVKSFFSKAFLNLRLKQSMVAKVRKDITTLMAVSQLDIDVKNVFICSIIFIFSSPLVC